MEHFQEHGLQEQSDGKHVSFVFPEGMHSILRDISLPSQINSEALQLARVAKMFRFEIFQVEKAFEFANKLPLNCQIVCPTAQIFLFQLYFMDHILKMMQGIMIQRVAHSISINPC